MPDEEDPQPPETDEPAREPVPPWDSVRGVPLQARIDERVTTPDKPVPVRVWIDAGRTAWQHCDGLAVAWTPRQVQVVYIDVHGRQGTTWVWANAVTRA
ncbi:hypothetical protein EDD28_2459 [Salana multivorans]|uniref:Uncharacterized protein n=1 Tax=Salana multivorans TaxID=120377 RepID=A0A3N2DDA7_9MICO|nr:hypothetical protein [Salana multivorans]ROR97770.1 hypothetical protein EDD28_2378 [Salana multivorans]ROR97849.1 hypothetical protein EDD28_2459 [Salana multivorans]